MTPEQVAGLRVYLALLPAGALVPLPREVVADLLDAPQAGEPAPGALPPPDLDVGALAKRWGRKPGTIRAWCERGTLPGAYRRNRREWRVPVAAVLAFEEAGRKDGEAPAAISPAPAPVRRGRAPDLGAWRKDAA